MLRATDTCTWAEHGTPQRDPGTRSLRTTSIRRPPTSPLPHFPTQFSVTERHVYLHPILRHHRLLEHLPRLLHQLLRADRVARRHVAQDQTLRVGRERDLRRLPRRRVPRLLRPILL